MDMDMYDVRREFEILIGRLEGTSTEEFGEQFYLACAECLNIVRAIFNKVSTRMNLNQEEQQEIRSLFAFTNYIIGRAYVENRGEEMRLL